MGVGMSRQRRRAIGGGDSPTLLLPLLGLQVLLQYGSDGASRPPLTAALIVANALVHLRPGGLDDCLPRLRRVTFNPYRIIQYGDLRRFFLSPFYHIDEIHLFINMTSLLWKGVHLETSMGSVEFALMVASLIGLSQSFNLLLSKGLLSFFGNGSEYYGQFSAGFSGVLSGMEVVLNSRLESVSIYGIVIPAKYVTWVNLLIAQAITPEASLIGRLGGILAGLAYLWLNGGPNPLALLNSDISNIVSRQVRFTQRLIRSGRREGSRVGRRASPRETGRGMWICSACTCVNSCSADICDTCSTPREDRDFSRRLHLQAGGNEEPAVEEPAVEEPVVEEIRRRRLQKFDR